MDEMETKDPSILSVLGELENLLDSKLETDPNIDTSLELNLEKEQFVCKICNFRSKSKQGLYIHGKRNHNMEKIASIQCQHCNFKTSTKAGLNVHNHKKHKDIYPGDFSCNFCTFTSTKTGVANHVHHFHKDKTKEKKVRDQSCRLCEYS